MVYRLMKHEPELSWGLLYLSAVSVATVLLGFQQTLFMAPFLCFLLGRPWRRATQFHAALPIAARQLFLARLLSIVPLIWAPQLLAVVVLASSGHPAGGELTALASAGIFTLAAAALQSVRLRELSSLRRPGAVFLGGWLLVTVLGATLTRIGPGRSLAVTCVSLAASAALFLRIWARLPQSFELGPAAPFEPAGGPGGVILPAPDSAAHPDSNAPEGRKTTDASARRAALPAWMPFLRTVFSPLYFLWLPCLCLAAALPSLIVMSAMLLPMLWMEPLRRAGWTLTLPVNRRLVLWATVAPPILALSASYAVSARLGMAHSPLRLHATALALIVAVPMASGLGFAGAGWRGLRWLPARILQWLPLGWCVLTFAAIWAGVLTGESRRFPEILQALAGALPSSRFEAAAALALPVVGLYFVLERVFLESDHTGKLGVWKHDWWAE